MMRISIDMSGTAGRILPQEMLLFQPRQRDLVLNVPLSFYTPLGKLLEDVSLSNKPVEELYIVILSLQKIRKRPRPSWAWGKPSVKGFTYHPTNMIALLQTLSIDANCFFHV